MLLGAGLLVQLAPLLLLPHVLTQDGPAHVDGAWVLLHHGDGGAVGAALREQYDLDLGPVPNLLTTLLLAGLLGVVGPDAAEKAVVVGAVLLLVGGLRYAVRGVDPRAGWLAVLALPLAGAQLVAFGFYNFVWGAGLALVALGFALRRRSGWDARDTAAAAVVLLLTWSAHLLPWAVAVTVVGALAAGRWAADVRAGGGPVPAARAHLLPVALAAAPTVVLSAVYAAGGGSEHGAVGGWPGIGRLGGLLTLYRPLVVAGWWELLPAALVAAVLVGLLGQALRRPGPADTGGPERAARADRRVLGAASVVSVLAVLLTPDRLGGEYGFLADRLSWFPPLLLTLFCATRPPRRGALQRAAVVVVVLAATAALVVRLPTQLADQRRAAEFLSVADEIPPGAVFAVLRYSRHQQAPAPVPGAPDPLRHLSSRLAVEVGGVDLGHYEAVYPYFQVRFPEHSLREAVDPGLDGLDAVPPWVHLPAAEGRLDYVLVVGLDQAEPWVRSAQRTAGVLADLHASYEEVARSGPSGYVTVWRLRDPTVG